MQSLSWPLPIMGTVFYSVKFKIEASFKQEFDGRRVGSSGESNVGLGLNLNSPPCVADFSMLIGEDAPWLLLKVLEVC